MSTFVLLLAAGLAPGDGSGAAWSGIYKYEAGRLLISFCREARRPDPTTAATGGGALFP
jgi:hypothetical protein